MSTGVPCLPLYYGWKCNYCGDCFASEGAFRNHCNDKHKIPKAKAASMIDSCQHLVQKKFTKGREYYPVVDPAIILPVHRESPLAVTNPRLKQFVNEINAARKSLKVGDMIRDASTTRECSQFYSATHFNVISEASVDAKRELAQCLAHGEPDSIGDNVLKNLCEAYIKSVNTKIASSGGVVLFRIQSSDRTDCNTITDDSRGGHQKDHFTGVKSVKAYSSCLRKMINFFFNLDTLLDTPSSKIRNDTATMKVLEPYNENLSNTTLVKSLRESIERLANADVETFEFHQEAAINSITIFVEGLLKLKHSISKPYYTSIIHTFIFATHLKIGSDTVRFGRISTIGNICAQLMFIFKGAVLHLVHQADGSSPHIQDDALKLLSLRDFESAFSIAVSLLKIVQSTTHDITTATTVSYGVNTDNRVDLSILIIGGEVVPVNRIHQGSTDLLNELVNSMKVCLFDFKLPDLLFEGILDDIGNEEPRYWFGIDSRNTKLLDARDEFQLHVLSRLNSGFVGSEGSSVLKLDMKAAKVYFEHCSRLLEMMITSEHIFSGSPARGTEKSRLLVRNYVGSGGVVHMRNVFYLSQFQAIALIPSYNKKGTKYIPRFLKGELASCFIFVQVMLRPTLELIKYHMESHRFGDTSMLEFIKLRSEDNDFVWTDVGGIALDSEAIRWIFKRIFFDVFKLQISFSAYRQVSIKYPIS